MAGVASAAAGAHDVLAAFWWENPGWLIALLALATAAAGYLYRRPASASGESSAGFVGITSRRWQVVRTAVGGATGVALGASLLRLGTPAALVLLGALPLGATVWVVAALYRRQAAGLSELARLGVLGLRVLAAVLLVLIIGRPVWDWAVVEWRKPLLVALLDQSESMGIVDENLRAGGRPRAVVLNDELHAARRNLRKLAETHEVRMLGFGGGVEPLDEWRILAQAGVTGLAAALREAGEMRSADGARPGGVLILSDGAENVETAADVRKAAERLGQQGTGLYAVGVGPGPGEAPLVEFEPLVLPATLAPRDRVRVPIVARVQGCAGDALRLELLWDAQRAASEQVQMRSDIDRIATEFEVVPPGPGVHRLGVRVALPAARGSAVFETHTIVDVRDERIRVVQLEDAPRAEAAFLSRALESDPNFEVTRRFLYGEPGRGAGGSGSVDWSSFDVLIVGQLRPGALAGAWREVAAAVTDAGVGLLLAGGRSLFNDAGHQHSELATVSPTRFVRDEFGLAGPLSVVPTFEGLHHPVLRTLLPGAAGVAADPTAALQAWRALPPLGGAARLGDAKDLATVLLADAQGHPLLAVHEAGRGRAAAAGWESTWSWALASDEGAELHRRFWRQLTTWLANRRPRAWVLTDAPTYPHASLASGQRRIRVRAGVRGSQDTAPAEADLATATAQLDLVTPSERVPIRLTRGRDEWLAEVPGPGLPPLPAGNYTLEFAVSPAADDKQPADADSDPERLTARTAFEVVPVQIEHTAPTANLALLRAAAERTAPHGGGMWTAAELPELIERLAAADRREEVRRRLRYSTVDHEPGALLLALAGVLALEWAVRRRCSLP